MNAPPFYTITQAAKILGINPASFRSGRHKGLIVMHESARCRVVPRAALLELIGDRSAMKRDLLDLDQFIIAGIVGRPWQKGGAA